MVIYKKSASRIIFEIFNYAMMTLLSVSIILPFLNVIAISLSSRNAVIHFKVTLWPVDFNLEAYKTIVGNPHFWRCFLNTTCLAIINTALTLVLSMATGYALNSKYFVGKKIFSNFLLIPSYFSGGIIPFYLLVNGIGLNDSYLALILPVIAATGQIIIFRAAISQVPVELMDSADVDGAGDLTTAFVIILPVILPIAAAFAIFTIISHWNDWFNCLLFLRDRNKWTLQFKLRDIMSSSSEALLDINSPLLGFIDKHLTHPENIKMAALMTTVLPIIAVYPYLQRYFIKGVIVGAVKA